MFRLKTQIGDQSGITQTFSHYGHEVQHMGPALKHNLQRSNHKKENLGFLCTWFKVKAPLEQLLWCPLLEVYLNQLYRPAPPQWFCVKLLSLSEAYALWSTEKVKWSIYKTRRKKKVRQKESKRAKRTWLPVQCGVGPVQTFSSSVPFHGVQRSSWQPVMFVSALLVVPLCSHHCCFSLFLCSSSSSYSSHISFPTHFLSCSSLCIPASLAALSTKVMHSGWSDSPLRHISRSIMLPLVISVGWVSDMSGEDSSQASFQKGDEYWSTDG